MNCLRVLGNNIRVLLKQRRIEKADFACQFLQCIQPFKRSENREKILDIFDMYCDLLEIAEERNHLPC